MSFYDHRLSDAVVFLVVILILLAPIIPSSPFFTRFPDLCLTFAYGSLYLFLSEDSLMTNELGNNL